ncbi:TnsA-like heteromeric transposase endonuclease subunit [Micromonospora sp. B11E3]|uniref:TnsA-like heteromeric transposase endonuclease subunit n=1 Tax=Micromonospora sp. B11E3 TaxID=3153562 RepID=UPI00325F8340
MDRWLVLDGGGWVGGLVALPGGSPAASRGFELAYVGAEGREQRESLVAASGVRFELVTPVRPFPSYRGQRSNSGLWWCATTGGHVGYESWLERDQLTLLDFDQAIVGIASQPFWLFWQDEGRRRSHAPDFFARRVDGTGVVVDVRPEGRVRARDAAAFAATRRACAAVGWDYRLVHEPEAVRMANVRWLAGYRHPRCRREAVVAAAPVVFAEPVALMHGAARLGDPLATLPTVFHLLWWAGCTLTLRCRCRSCRWWRRWTVEQRAGSAARGRPGAVRWSGGDGRWL